MPRTTRRHGGSEQTRELTFEQERALRAAAKAVRASEPAFDAAVSNDATNQSVSVLLQEAQNVGTFQGEEISIGPMDIDVVSIGGPGEAMAATTVSTAATPKTVPAGATQPTRAVAMPVGVVLGATGPLVDALGELAGRPVAQTVEKDGDVSDTEVEDGDDAESMVDDADSTTVDAATGSARPFLANAVAAAEAVLLEAKAVEDEASADKKALPQMILYCTTMRYVENKRPILHVRLTYVSWELCGVHGGWVRHMACAHEHVAQCV